MRNQPNPGDAQGICYRPPRSMGFSVAVSARIDWRWQPGQLAPGSSFFAQHRLQPALAESGGQGLPVTGLAVLEAAEALHHVKGRAVNLDRINRRPTMEPLAPTPCILRAPLSHGSR